jgi:hypothetical protein
VNIGCGLSRVRHLSFKGAARNQYFTLGYFICKIQDSRLIEADLNKIASSRVEQAEGSKVYIFFPERDVRK